MNGTSSQDNRRSTEAALSARASQPLRSSRPSEANRETISDEQLSVLDPRMAALSISNDALRDSMRPPAPLSLHTWIDEHTGGSLRKLENGVQNGLYWLYTRAAWQRLAICTASGALVGLGIVFGGAKFLGIGAGDAMASAEVASADVAVDSASTAAAELVAPVRRVVALQPAATAPLETRAAPEPMIPSQAALALEPAVPEEPVVEQPAPTEKRAKAKSKRGRARHHKAHARRTH